MQKVARIITEVLSPTVLVTGFLLLTGWLAAGGRGLLFGLVAAVFTAIGPFAGILLATRRGKLSDHHVSQREQRLPVLLSSVASAALGFAVLLALGAPATATVGLVAVASGMVIVGAVNAFWKLSVHMAVAVFVSTAVASAHGPTWLPAVFAAGVIGWSRIQLGDHTPAQVVAAVPAGLAVTAGYALMA
ncbi:hypothetical protein [Arthrobacter sp. SW1]|uniref:hypothetical protein n=1 Tax=Arthrobacter sp. SW1 TaxID=1920889 RepID=UPI0009F4C9AA|nr:hypothetical protein [Arthrobacter sp. SW1]